MIEIGDKVRFVKLLSESPEDWFISPEQLIHIKGLLGRTGTILYVEVRYKDDGTKEYFLDVRFPIGYILKRANSLAFEFIDLSYT